MALVYRSHSGRKEPKYLSTSGSSQKVSPLIILQARFQQKQLQEKEEKLLKLYEEQQERALKSVGSRSQSGGSSGSSVGGGGKVRHMFQSRRENSEARHGAAITGRDKSYPLKPITKHSSIRNLKSKRSDDISVPVPQQRSFSLDRHRSESPPPPPRRRHHRNDIFSDSDPDENFNYANPEEIKRLERRRLNRNANLVYFGGSHADLKFSDELDFGQSFHLVDDHYEDYYERRDSGHERNAVRDEDRFLTSFDVKRQFYENRLRGEDSNANFILPGDGYSGSRSSVNKMDGRYKSYVSQSTFGKKVHLGGSGGLAGKTGLSSRQATEPKETSASGYANGSVNSPVRKIRKPTPVPLSVAPSQHLLQKEQKRISMRTEPIREVPTGLSSSSSSSLRTSASRTQSTTGTSSKPTPLGRVSVQSRTTPPAKTTLPAKSSLPSDLVNCRICGRHFAADRVGKHEEVCQKSTKSKRKPFDALQQRVKGTEVEKYIKKSSKTFRAQPEKQVKPQSNWRKKHEEFINNIRAAKEVSAHLKKGGKLSDLPPPPPSDYSDYVQCPHCSRKFNASAAERHIPKCANIINNKPKASLQKNSGLKQGSKLLHASPAVRGRK